MSIGIVPLPVCGGQCTGLCCSVLGLWHQGWRGQQRSQTGTEQRGVSGGGGWRTRSKPKQPLTLFTKSCGRWATRSSHPGEELCFRRSFVPTDCTAAVEGTHHHHTDHTTILFCAILLYLTLLILISFYWYHTSYPILYSHTVLNHVMIICMFM